MRLLTTIAERLAGMVLTLLVTSFVIFGALYAAPGSPLSHLVGGRTVTPEQIRLVTEQYHLDSPFLERYVLWLRDIFTGDLGTSFVFKQNVLDLIKPRLPLTLFLVTYAALLIGVVGLVTGFIAARSKGFVARSAMLGTTVALATPSFVAGVILISLLSVKFPIFPVFGAGEGIFDVLYHLTLPAVAIAVGGVALVARVTRAAIDEEQSKEFVEAARSRGVRETRTVIRHVVRNALIPISTVLGITVASILAQSVVVENVFSLNGLGSLLVSSVQAKDFAVVQAVTLVFVFTFIVVNTIVDLLYPLIDPRLRALR